MCTAPTRHGVMCKSNSKDYMIPYGGFFLRITNFANDLYPEIHEINFRECIVDSLLIN